MLCGCDKGVYAKYNSRNQNRARHEEAHIAGGNVIKYFIGYVPKEPTEDETLDCGCSKAVYLARGSKSNISRHVKDHKEGKVKVKTYYKPSSGGEEEEEDEMQEELEEELEEEMQEEMEEELEEELEEEMQGEMQKELEEELEEEPEEELEEEPEEELEEELDEFYYDEEGDEEGAEGGGRSKRQRT